LLRDVLVLPFKLSFKLSQLVVLVACPPSCRRVADLAYTAGRNPLKTTQNQIKLLKNGGGKIGEAGRLNYLFGFGWFSSTIRLTCEIPNHL
jgi:hypothetical protein